jgi:hypothetical protein
MKKLINNPLIHGFNFENDEIFFKTAMLNFLKHQNGKEQFFIYFESFLLEFYNQNKTLREITKFRNHQNFERNFIFLSKEKQISILKYLYEESLKQYLHDENIEKAFLVYTHTKLSKDFKEIKKIFDFKFKQDTILLNGPFTKNTYPLELNPVQKDEILAIDFEPVVFKKDLSAYVFNLFFNSSLYKENVNKKQILKQLLFDMNELNTAMTLDSLKFLVENSIFSVEYLTKQKVINSNALRNYMIDFYFEKDSRVAYFVLKSLLKTDESNTLNLTIFLKVFKYFEIFQIETILNTLSKNELPYANNIPVDSLVQNLNAGNLNEFTKIIKYLKNILKKEKYQFFELKLIQIYADDFDLYNLKKFLFDKKNQLSNSILIDLLYISKSNMKLKELISQEIKNSSSSDSLKVGNSKMEQIEKLFEENNLKSTSEDLRTEEFVENTLLKNLKFLLEKDIFLKEIFYFYLKENLFSASCKLFCFINFQQKEKEILIFNYWKEKVSQFKEISHFHFYLKQISLDNQTFFLNNLFNISLEFENLNFTSLVYSTMRNQLILPTTKQYESIFLIFHKKSNFSHIWLFFEDFLELNLVPTKQMLSILLNISESEYQFNYVVNISKKFNLSISHHPLEKMNSSNFKDCHSNYFRKKINLKSEISKHDLGYEEISNLELVSLQ